MTDVTQHPLYRAILTEDIGCAEGFLPTDIHEGLEILLAERGRLHALLQHVAEIIDTTDSEHAAFVDSGADSIAMLWAINADIRAAIIGSAAPASAMSKLSCPICGEETHIYVKADLRWSPESGAWKVDEAETHDAECTECDHRFELPEGTPDPLGAIISGQG